MTSHTEQFSKELELGLIDSLSEDKSDQVFIQRIVESKTLLAITADKPKQKLYFIKNMIAPVEGNLKDNNIKLMADYYFNPVKPVDPKHTRFGGALLSFFVKSKHDLPASVWREWQYMGNDQSRNTMPSSLTFDKVVPQSQDDIDKYCSNILHFEKHEKEEEIRASSVFCLNTQFALTDTNTMYFLDGIPHSLVWENGTEKEGKMTWNRVPKLLGVLVNLSSFDLDTKLEDWKLIVNKLNEFTRAINAAMVAKFAHVTDSVEKTKEVYDPNWLYIKQ